MIAREGTAPSTTATPPYVLCGVRDHSMVTRYEGRRWALIPLRSRTLERSYATLAKEGVCLSQRGMAIHDLRRNKIKKDWHTRKRFLTKMIGNPPKPENVQLFDNGCLP